MYEYRAAVIRVVDGDTVWLDVDLGFDVRRRDSFRLFGIDTPELPTEEGFAAKAALERLLGVGASPVPVITVRTVRDKREKFGRYLASLYVDGNADSVNQQLIDAGHGQPYVVASAVLPGEE